jgi:predicted RNase H-like HicB family nuclease
MFKKPLFVRVEWDEEAKVWVATSDDVAGLATEADTMEKLIEKLKILIPELLVANGMSGEFDVPFEILGYQRNFDAFVKSQNFENRTS